MILHFIIFSIGILNTFQKITIRQNSIIVGQLAEYSAYIYSNNFSQFIGPLVDGKNRCNGFPDFDYQSDYTQKPFLLLFRNSHCSDIDQITNAFRQGYKHIIYASYIDFRRISYRLPADGDYVIIIVQPSLGVYLSNYTYETNSLIIYTPFILPPYFRIFPVMVLFMSLFGAVYLVITYISSFVSNKLKILKARNRIYSLPSRKCTEADINETCPICFDNYVTGVKLCVLKCHHEYHQSCLVKWSGETCPLCRDPLFSDKVALGTQTYSTPDVSIPMSSGCDEGRMALINNESQEHLSIIIEDHAYPSQDIGNNSPKPNYSSSVEILNFTSNYSDV